MTTTLDSLVLSVRIERPWEDVRAALADPATWPRWAAGLAEGLERRGEAWVGHIPGGTIQVRFSAPNTFGIADHWVTLPDGSEIYIPVRAIRSGEGTEVQLTLQRQPSMTDADFAGDADAVRRDLAALKAMLEAGGQSK